MIKEFWPEVSGEEFKPNWHIENVICKELEKVAHRVANSIPNDYDLIINVPPGTTKTVSCSVMFPVWCWINWYWMKFLCFSYADLLSLESAEYSRDIVRSNKFRTYFPELDMKQDKDTKSNFKLQRTTIDESTGKKVVEAGGNRFSTSVGGTATGFHGHFLIVDDPLNPSQAVSATKLKTAQYFMDHTLSTRKVDKKVTTTIIIMQRLHQNDPTGHMLAKKGKNIRHICLPGVLKMGDVDYGKYVNPPELKDLYVDGLLDPVRMDQNILNTMLADLGQYGFAGQVGQSPTPPGGGMFKVDNFHVIDTLPIPVNFVNIVRYWDKAGSAGKGAYTAGVRMIKLKNGKFIITDCKRGQWAAEEREAIIKSRAEADALSEGMPTKTYVEQEPGSGGKESAEATIRNLAGHAAFKDRPVGNKIYRADPYSVQVNNGNVMILRGEWNYEFIEEHRFSPFSTYKDQVDAASGAFKELTAKKLVKILG